MKALLLAIQKIIAVITALFVPASTVAPLATNHNIQNDGSTVRIVEEAEDEDEDIEIVEDDRQINFDEEFSDENAAEPVAIDELDAEEAEEPVYEAKAYARAEEFVPVQTWDVSATEDDDVVMAFFDTEDAEGLLDQLAGRITALFAPMTAYAAGYEYFEEDGILNTANEYGEDAAANEVREIEAGTVVVYGTGAMQKDIYSYFIDKDLYLETTVALFKAEEGLDVTPIVPEGVEDIVELDAVVRWQITGTDEYAEITDAMREALNPTDMLRYKPTRIIIDEGVTNVADFAFAFFGNVERIDIPSTVTEIGEFAFAYCDHLAEVNLPANLRVIGDGAFLYCTALEEITVPANVEYIGDYAFVNIAENSTITCPNANLFNEDNYTVGRTVIA